MADSSSKAQRDLIERLARKAGFDDQDHAIKTFDKSFSVGWKLSKNEASIVIDALDDGRLVPPPPKDPEPVQTAPDGGMPAEVAVAMLERTVTVKGVSGKTFEFVPECIRLAGERQVATLIGMGTNGRTTSVALDRVVSWQVTE